MREIPRGAPARGAEVASPQRGLITESCGAKNAFQTLHLNAANSIMMPSVISLLWESLKSAEVQSG